MPEEFFADVINQIPKNEKTALDIGANIGNYTRQLASKFKKVYAFEPDPVNVRMLKVRLESNEVKNAEIIPKAVSDKTGKFRLYQSGDPGQNSLSLTVAQLELWNYSPVKFIEVDCITLDDFVKEKNIQDIEIMKVDIEGGEDFMFDGAKETLKNLSPMILLECHKCVNYGRLTKLFKEFGYKFFSIETGRSEELFPGCFFLIYNSEGFYI